MTEQTEITEQAEPSPFAFRFLRYFRLFRFSHNNQERSSL